MPVAAFLYGSIALYGSVGGSSGCFAGGGPGGKGGGDAGFGTGGGDAGFGKSGGGTAIGCCGKSGGGNLVGGGPGGFGKSGGGADFVGDRNRCLEEPVAPRGTTKVDPEEEAPHPETEADDEAGCGTGPPNQAGGGNGGGTCRGGGLRVRKSCSATW